MDSDLLKEAKQGVEDLNSFIERVLLLEDEAMAGAIGSVAVLKALVGDKNLSKSVWLLIEYLSDNENPDFLRLLRIKKLLFPESKSRYISITPGIFKLLQEEAQILLESTDATDEKRYYWKSIIKRNPPPGIIIEDI